MFWNMGGSKKNKIREPKIEIYNHTPIHALLNQWAALHSVEIIPEAKNAAGNMDLCLVGSVVGVGNVSICIEIKHAHSDDIEHGLKVQLPEYMKRKGAVFGIYIVLWFKGEEWFFDRPNIESVKKIYKSLGEDDCNDITGSLSNFEIAISLLRISLPESKNLREFIIDVSKPVSASKL